MGLWAGSLALVADAGHMVNDAAALGLAAGAAWLARRAPSVRHSYGLGRAEFLAALINSAALLLLVAWLVVSAITRLHTPHAVQGVAVSLTAALGLALNLLVAWMLTHGRCSPRHQSGTPNQRFPVNHPPAVAPVPIDGLPRLVVHPSN